jgi:uncharacterized membrane protein YgdD (TMEM256/DUF423 family)
MHKGYLRLSFVLAAITVALGAFGAHQLDGLVPEKALMTFETAVRYQFYHVIALALAAILYREYPSRSIRLAGTFFVLGIILFCGSLYLLTWKTASDIPWLKWAGPVTPLGGVCFIAGWILLASGVKNRDH